MNLLGWKGYAAAAAAGGLALGAATLWACSLYYGTQLAELQSAFDQHKAGVATTATESSEAARAVENTDVDNREENRAQTNTELDQLRADNARLAGSAERVRRELAGYLRAHQERASATAAAGEPPGPSAGVVLADMYSSARAEAIRIGGEADKRRAKGLSCEREYDAVEAARRTTAAPPNQSPGSSEGSPPP